MPETEYTLYENDVQPLLYIGSCYTTLEYYILLLELCNQSEAFQKSLQMSCTQRSFNHRILLMSL